MAEESQALFIDFMVGDSVEVFVNGSWIPAKLVLASSRSVIAEYKTSNGIFQKLYRNMENIAKKGTHLTDEHKSEDFTIQDVSKDIKESIESPKDLIERAQKQRIANQQLVRQQLRLREDFDRLCQEFGQLKMQFESSAEPTPSSGLNFNLNSESEGICPHFLKGKCRFKDKCRQSHDITYCVYCQAKLPSNKVAASAHLSKCYRRTENWQKQNQSSQT
jgi:hypothetical protein